MGKGKVLRIFDSRALIEDLDEVSPKVVITQEKDTGKRQFIKGNPPTTDLTGSPQVIPFEAIFGFYDLLSGSYIALITESESFVGLNFLNIRKVKKVVILPLFRNGRILSDTKQKDEDRYLELLNLAFSEHTFFFSFTSDITLTQQRIAKVNQNKNGNGNDLFPWQRADFRFFWNRDLVQELVAQRIDEWIVVCMSAFIEIRTDCLIDDIKFHFLLISRRSKFRQGCRFIKRGIDDNGNAANFVETEQILGFPDGKITSFVQVRGSIPVKWMSPVHMRYEPNVFIDEASSPEATTKHIHELVDKYSDNTAQASVVFINLIDNKKDQGRLGVAFKEAIDQAKPKFQGYPLHFVWFDFHHECKQKGKWQNLSKLVSQVDDLFKAQRFFCKLSSGVVVSWQSGVIRTNCMDNLDRTNVIQSLLARRSLIYQLNKNESVDLANKHILDTPWKNFEVIFKTVWTNNANAMSLGYAGTGALKTDFTKTGKRTFKGMINDGMNSVTRYYVNNFTDGVKQDAIDLMLGRYVPNPNEPSPFLSRTSQGGLSSNLTKIFVFMTTIFSALLLLLPPVMPLTGSGRSVINIDLNDDDIHEKEDIERNLEHLRTHFIVSLLITLAVLAYFMYKIVKKGSKIGEKMVVHPQFCPEPLPPGRE
eukprot:gene1548-1687_t